MTIFVYVFGFCDNPYWGYSNTDGCKRLLLELQHGTLLRYNGKNNNLY